MRIPFLLLAVWLALPVAAADLESRRAEFRAALTQAERGPPLAPQARRTLADHPLYPYLEYAELLRDLRSARAEDVRDLLERHAELPFTGALRTAFLRELARREDWPAFVAFWRGSSDVELQCHALRARLATGAGDEVLDDITALWRHGQSRPNACDPLFAHLQARGRLDAALRWERIELAAEAGNASLMRFVARGLDDGDRRRAEQHARFIEQPTADAASWPVDARSRRIAVAGLERMARRDPGGTESLLSSLQRPLGFGDDEQGRVRYAIALWSAAAFAPESARRFEAVPTPAFDERLHEWRAREALARGDGEAVLTAIAAMGPTQREEMRWRYIAARMHERAGRVDEARTRFAALATEPTYFGFLAADRIEAPYALCPLEVADSRPARRALQGIAGFVRALELHAIERPQWALREWTVLQPQLGDDERRLAVQIAVDAGWTDRAVFAMSSGDDLRHYRLRFPLAHDKHLRAEATRHGLDPGWVAALIRAESAWQPDARSHADARGLMQILPGTGAGVARRHGIDWSGPNTLYQPRTNISLGTAYLGEMLARHDGLAFLATAAYNAGPTPVARWRAQRPVGDDVDLWTETIPFRETREYVARIMAFAVIYDWRLHGRAVPVHERMRGRGTPTRAFACPTG